MKAELFTKYHARRVRLNKGGYDSCGSYWGVDLPLYYVTFTYEGCEYSAHFRASDNAGAIEAAKRHNEERYYGPW